MGQGAAYGPRAALALRGRPHRLHRLPLLGGPDPPAPGPVGRGSARRRGAAGHLRQGVLLRRAHGPRPGDRAARHQGPAAHRQGDRGPAAGHQRLPLRAPRGPHHPGRDAVHQLRLRALRSRPLQVRRRHLLPAPRRRDAPPLLRDAPGMRQHPARGRAVRRALPHRGRGGLIHAGLPRPRGGDRRVLVHQGVLARHGPPVQRRHPRGLPQAGRVRDQRHHPDGVPRLLPRRGRLHQLGQGPRHPGRAGAWIGSRLHGRLRHGHHRAQPAAPRTHLRALPQPRAHLHARYRRRLRRAPARRGHRVRA